MLLQKTATWYSQSVELHNIATYGKYVQKFLQYKW